MYGFAMVGVSMMLSGCGGTEFVNTAELPETYQCQHMKDVCKEAREFEGIYSRMSPEERKDAENVLKAYRMQCNDALEICQKSGKKQKK
jgi:type IV pilus biogenesis protein CpaD/CtpE